MDPPGECLTTERVVVVSFVFAVPAAVSPLNRAGLLLLFHRLFESKAFAVHLKDLRMVSQAVQQSGRHAFSLEDLSPVAERKVAGDQQAATFVPICEDGFLKDARHLIVDRDTSFIVMREFLEQNTDTEVVLLPPKSPNLNAYMERWFRSLKSECLDRMIFFVQRSLERAVTNFVQHYHAERNHQGLSNHLIDPEKRVGAVAGKIECRERLGGMLKYYHRRAA